MSVSGKFVLRIPTELHRKLKERAKESDHSLNQHITNLLSSQLPEETDSSSELLKTVRDCWAPIAIIQFGSSVRGEQRKSSDIDWLVVLPSSEKVSRTSYRKWDQIVATNPDWQKYSVSLVHPFHWPQEDLSNLWLEVAFEGCILFCEDPLFKKRFNELRDAIARGRFIRKSSHGQNYWVRTEEK